MDHESAKQTAAAFVRAMESSSTDVFADDVFCDINVPEWRFQMQGAAAVKEWLTGELPDGCCVPTWRSDPTADGCIVELEQRYDRDGIEISSRNVHRLEVRDGKVTEWTMYCTGEWTPELRERQAREAPMIRP
jgi:hypothetical protein